MINDDVVDRLLDMSRLELDSGSKAGFVHKLNDIITFIDKISEVDTSSVMDRESVFEEVNVSDNDTVGQSFSQPELRKYTKNYLDGYFAVPKVM